MMAFYIYDANEYFGTISFTTEDYEHEFCADVNDCYNYDTEEWEEDRVRASAEAQILEAFPGAQIIWQYI